MTVTEALPAVEPAQPPMNISATSSPREKFGHWSKSAEANPVVVMMEVTWKAAARKPSAYTLYAVR
jgi:hypothetical protein